MTAVLRHPRALHPAAPRLVAEALREGKYDVVHAHSGIWSPFGWRSRRRRGHPGRHPGRGHPALAAHLVRPGFRVADLALRWSAWPVQLTAVSEVAAAPLRRLVGPDREVLVLPNGIDPAAWRVRPRPAPPDQVRSSA